MSIISCLSVITPGRWAVGSGHPHTHAQLAPHANLLPLLVERAPPNSPDRGLSDCAQACSPHAAGLELHSSSTQHSTDDSLPPSSSMNIGRAVVQLVVSGLPSCAAVQLSTAYPMCTHHHHHHHHRHHHHTCSWRPRVPLSRRIARRRLDLGTESYGRLYGTTSQQIGQDWWTCPYSAHCAVSPLMGVLVAWTRKDSHKARQGHHTVQ